VKKFANETHVPVSRSRQEIEETLTRFGASAFAYAAAGSRAQIMFEFQGRRIRFTVELPTEEDVIQTTSGRNRHSAKNRRVALEQETKRVWRSFALNIKSKLVAVQDGVETFEEAFMAKVVLPNGQTVGEWMKPQIAEAYATGQMPPLLLAPPERG